MRILVVEDSKPIVNVVRGMLEAAGYEVLEAENGEVAVFTLQKEKVDYILLDWNMPNMNGIEFLDYNSKHQITDAKVLMMTTENKPEKIMKALELGAVEYIMKPFTSDILISKIKSV